MGKFVVRLSSKKKAKRWRKGQSASSNPETKKYREQARNCFFQPNLGSSTLTTEVLRKHDAIQGSKVEEMDVASTVEDATTFRTFDTFASDWSNCSNISFNRFLSHFQSNSAMHKEMLAVLAAVTEVIKQNGGTESSTEYYAALMTTLEVADTSESISAILSLLGMGMKTVPKNVLKLQFGKASSVFLQILTKYAADENNLILRHSIGCLSILLKVQEGAAWSDSSTINVLNALLAFITHTKPKIRKAAQHGICSVLKGSDIMKGEDAPPYHPAASTVAKHCLAQLQIAAQPGQLTSTLHILTLLKDIIPQIPKSYVKTLCEALLSIMTLNNVLVTSCCLQTLHGLFVSKPSEAVLPSELNAQIINALYDYQPAPGDTQPTLAWLAVMQEAYSNLAIYSLELCAINIPRIIEKCSELWLSDKPDILTGASHTIKALFENCLILLCAEENLITQFKSVLIKVINLIQEGMKYQYNSAWHHVLHLLALVLKIIGPCCQNEAKQILESLAELRESYKFVYNSEIEYAVGAAIKAMGPEFVLNALPLQTAKGEVDIKRSWLLPVLKDCTQKGSLSYFYNNLLPLAKNCDVRAKILHKKKEKIQAHSNELLVSQIWSLLPSFCNNAPDINENFKKLAETLGIIIRDRKDLRTFPMAALRKLITKSVDNNKLEDINELAKFAKNYLPLLFNMYTTKPNGTDEEGQRLSAIETIKVYLTITRKELIGELFDAGLKKLSETTDNDFLKESLFDLVRLLTQYTDIERIKILYEKCSPQINDNKHLKDQKKAYRFLEEICASESEICKQFVQENRKDIQKLILTSVSTVLKPSKGARIRTINHLVNVHPQLEKTKFLKAIVPEAIMCTKELNEKCRLSAYKLLNDIAEKFIGNEENFSEFIDMLIYGLQGEAVYCSASLLALSSITYNYNGSLGIEKLNAVLTQALTLVTGTVREICLSALSFVKVYITSIPTPIVAPQLPNMMQGLLNMQEDCKRHFRQKVRDILIKLVRKFGTDTITSMVPLNDNIMLKRLKNIRKVETKKQKSKEKRKSDDDESEEEFSVKKKPKTLDEILADSDEEFDDSEDEKSNKNHKRKSNKKMWIKEDEDNITDFIDPSIATKNITSTLPSTERAANEKKAEKDFGFKTASDGRLIITDNTDDSDTEDPVNQKKKKSKKLSHLASDSEDDYEMDDDDKSVKSSKSSKSIHVPNRKRKISAGTASVKSDAQSMSKYQAGGSGIHRPLKKAKNEKGIGTEYKSKKGSGDVKLKGKPDPYAYIPLKRSTLNRRNKKKNGKDFKQFFSKSKKEKRQTNMKKRK